MIKSKGSKEAINKMDLKLCSMIVKYWKNYNGVNVLSEVANADTIDVLDSNNKNNNNYVDLDTVFATWCIAITVIVLCILHELSYFHIITCNSHTLKAFTHNITVFQWNI